MRVDFNQEIRNFNGIPIKIENEMMTLKYAAVTALLNSNPDEQGLPGAEKARRYKLAKAIHAGTADLSKEDLELIRTLIGKAFVPLIVGAALELLVPAPAIVNGKKPGKQA